MTGWARQLVYAAVFGALVSPIFAPRLLAFPFSAQIAGHRVYSEAPIAPRLATEVRIADALMARSPIGKARKPDQSIYLTRGGWRWTWLAAHLRGAFALTRPLAEAIVLNKSDQAADLVFNGGKVGGTRPLSQVIAHEMAHGAIRSHFEVAADWRYPAWLREGYCDFVSGGGSLSDEVAKQLIANGQDHPALTYWRGRKRVEAALGRNGGSVDALFADPGA